ncbi:ATP-binding protein [Mangrovactinospora gilvigrisea]|nr:NB-ARC domain-containing protein [Mangrovactinospora gilvigrisea]
MTTHEHGLWAGGLPPEGTELIGRRTELARLRELLGASRLVTLTGVGGVGKTRLALRAAADARPAFPDGVWWVELSALRRGSLLEQDIAEALPLTDQTTRPMIDILSDYLADRELLLVLDTCEHLVEDCALVAEALLEAAPGLRILATSLRPLGIEEERVLAVAPLPVEDAASLLAARAAETAPGSPADRPELMRLSRRLDGLPLALELAAARLGEMTVPELADRLDDRFAVLGTTDSVVDEADPPWHQALRTTVGWSHELCSPAERLLWARLSVFAGGFDAVAAVGVCADEHLPHETIPGLLAGLADRSLLVPATAGRSGPRFRMLDTIRDFGSFWLRGVGEEHALRHRHAEHYRSMAHRADAAWMGPDQLVWHERAVAEHANLRAALEFCLAEGDANRAQDLAGALWFLWVACGFAREGRHFLDRALALAPSPGLVRAKALWARCSTASVQGDAEALGRFSAAFHAAVAHDPDETAAVGDIQLRGRVHLANGQMKEALAVFETAPPSPPHDGRYPAAWFMAVSLEAFAHVFLGQAVEAAAIADEMRAACAGRGETWLRAWAEHMRALAALGLGRTEEAEALARAAVDGKRHLDDWTGIAMNIELLAAAAVRSGRAENAARLLGTAEVLWHTIGVPQSGVPVLIASHTACEDRTRELLGDEAYRTAFAAGRDAGPEAGIAYALAPPPTG